MTEEEMVFLDSLALLSDEELGNWIRKHYSSISYLPKAPFVSFNDSMDVLERTLGLLNRAYKQLSYHPLHDRFENILVFEFSKEANHSFILPDLVHRYISIFINCLLKGEARNKLVAVLFPIIAAKTWQTIKIGARNLHYDALELLVSSYSILEKRFLENYSINEYLLNNIAIEKNARFSNISLSHFTDTSQTEHFFKAFEMSFRVLPDEDKRSLVDPLLYLYKKYEWVSTGLLAEWISLYQMKAEDSKLRELFINGKILRLLIKKLEQNCKELEKSNDPERQNIIGLVTFILSKYFPEKLSPYLISLFFRNEKINGTGERLSRMRSSLYRTEKRAISRLFSYADYSNPSYAKLHIVVLNNLVELCLDLNEQDYNTDQPICHVNLNKDDYFNDDDYVTRYYWNTENYNSDALHSAFHLTKFHRHKEEISSDEFPYSLEWWYFLEQSNASRVNIPDLQL